jgi:hypothetical protein
MLSSQRLWPRSWSCWVGFIASLYEKHGQNAVKNSGALRTAFIEKAIHISNVHDGCEADRIQAGASYQESVNLRLRHETLGIVRLDAATIFA